MRFVTVYNPFMIMAAVGHLAFPSCCTFYFTDDLRLADIATQWQFISPGKYVCVNIFS